MSAIPHEAHREGDAGRRADPAHTRLLDGPFWQAIPAYREVDEATFGDHAWQARHAVTSADGLRAALGGRASPSLIDDVALGMARATMSVRVTPYLLSLIGWDDPVDDPLRRQFFPLASELSPDHPLLTLDSLHEQGDAVVPGLVHRYGDRVLFLATATCPVYCRFCTRSYAVGADTPGVEKVRLRLRDGRWRRAFDYVAATPAVEDVLVSGGDAWQLRADQVTEIGDALLAIPHVRRVRFASRGLVASPQKVLTDGRWTDALTRVVDRGRALHKEVALHAHFNHPREVTAVTRRATGLLMERGVFVRSQAVLQRGVNDDPAVMTALVKRLGYANAHAYYVYVHDLVRGVEDLRTSLAAALRVEKHVRGATAGFNTPVFVVDAPGGGGKRDAHSYEHYDRETGLSVFVAPAVRPGARFLYADPLHSLAPAQRLRWGDPGERERMIGDAVARAHDAPR